MKETSRQVVEEAVQRLTSLLPPRWDVVPTAESVVAGPIDDAGVDASIIIRAPNGETVTFLAAIKTGRVLGVDRVIDHLRRVRGRTGVDVLLIAPYLGPVLRQQCELNDINYLDLTGWCWLHVSVPGIAVRATGAARDPSPPRASIITRLNGPGASRVLRALLEDGLPVGVRALSQRAYVSAGTVAKVLKELDSEAVLTRDLSGRVMTVRKRQLVERWTRDYSFLKTNRIGWYLAPRGIQDVPANMSTEDIRFVATGSLAARRILSELPASGTLAVTPLSQLAVYVPRIGEAATKLRLVPAERPVANILLAEPYDVQLLDRRSDVSGELPVVDVGQTLADLKTMPGRAPQEADQVIEMLSSVDNSWE